MMSYMCFLLFGLAAGLLNAKLGVQFDKRATSLPILTLPYGQFQASSYNSNSDVCKTMLICDGVMMTHIRFVVC